MDELLPLAAEARDMELASTRHVPGKFFFYPASVEFFRRKNYARSRMQIPLDQSSALIEQRVEKTFSTR